MDIYHQPIPDGSYMLWFVPDGESPYREEGYTLRIDLLNLGGGICEASGAIGEMDRDTIINIGLKAIELGFRVLQSHAVKGSQVTELLTHVGSDDIFDYYRVDLHYAAEQLMKDAAL